MDMHNSFTHLHQSSTALYYKFISCYFILWVEPCVFVFFTYTNVISVLGLYQVIH